MRPSKEITGPTSPYVYDFLDIRKNVLSSILILEVSRYLSNRKVAVINKEKILLEDFRIYDIGIHSNEGLIINRGEERFSIANIAPEFPHHCSINFRVNNKLTQYWMQFGIEPDFTENPDILELSLDADESVSTTIFLGKTNYDQGMGDNNFNRKLNNDQRKIIAALLILPENLFKKVGRKGLILNETISTILNGTITENSLLLPGNLLPNLGNVGYSDDKLFIVSLNGERSGEILKNQEFLDKINPISLVLK